MRFVADESVDAQIVARLREDGFDVFYIAEAGPFRRHGLQFIPETWVTLLF